MKHIPTIIRAARFVVRCITLPFAVLRLLQSIDSRLADIQRTAKRIDGCCTDDNHRHRDCLRTGHWNDH